MARLLTSMHHTSAHPAACTPQTLHHRPAPRLITNILAGFTAQITHIIPVLIFTAHGCRRRTSSGRIDSNSTVDGSAQLRARTTDVGGSTRAVDAAAASIWMRSSSTRSQFFAAAARRRGTHSVAHDITPARIMQAIPRTIQLASHKFDVQLKR